MTITGTGPSSDSLARNFVYAPRTAFRSGASPGVSLKTSRMTLAKGWKPTLALEESPLGPVNGSSRLISFSANPPPPAIHFSAQSSANLGKPHAKTEGLLDGHTRELKIIMGTAAGPWRDLRCLSSACRRHRQGGAIARVGGGFH